MATTMGKWANLGEIQATFYNIGGTWQIAYIFQTATGMGVYNIYIYISPRKTENLKQTSVIDWMHIISIISQFSGAARRTTLKMSINYLLVVSTSQKWRSSSGIYHVESFNVIWVSYNISPTWIKAIWGWFPLLTMIPVRSQWGRYNLPRCHVKFRLDLPAKQIIINSIQFIHCPWQPWLTLPRNLNLGLSGACLDTHGETVVAR